MSDRLAGTRGPTMAKIGHDLNLYTEWPRKSENTSMIGELMIWCLGRDVTELCLII